MSVYFIRLGPYLKVGYSETPERRFRRLFAGSTSYSAPWDCPRRLNARVLLGHVHGTKDDERTAHDALADFGVGCEFYLAEDDALAYVASCLERGAIPAAHVPRPTGPAQFVGQVPPTASARSLPEVTSARLAAAHHTNPAREDDSWGRKGRGAA